jgi:hypothetical protein
MEKHPSVLVLEGSIAASSALSREFNMDNSGPDSLSRGDIVAGGSGVVVRLRLGRGVVSSFESLRLEAFLPVLCVTKYWHDVPLLAHLVHWGLSLEHFVLEVAQAWQLSRSRIPDGGGMTAIDPTPNDTGACNFLVGMEKAG